VMQELPVEGLSRMEECRKKTPQGPTIFPD
jgi:hypothetical protein